MRYGFCGLCLALCLGLGLTPAVGAKTSARRTETPEPTRFVVRDRRVMDLATGQAVFFKGVGYSPFLQGESPLNGFNPADDGRFQGHFARFRELHVNYLHLFPFKLPAGFFAELDKTRLVYGQDIWVFPYAHDFLEKDWQDWSLERIREAIDHTYAVGRPDRLVFFSIGDELTAESVARTDKLHPETRDFHGKYLTLSGRSATEVAMAMLIDQAMDYELRRYGRRHLYCHTSWTHIGPVAERPDLEVPPESVLVPDMGDLVCMNVYTYARGVKTSPPGSKTGTSYQGYLEDLLAQADRPVLITQVGLSTSPIEPRPKEVPGFGGHRVEAVPEALVAVWRDAHSARGREGLAGLVFFELHDEWWKSGEDPTDSTRHEPQDPEEWFGLYELGEKNVLIPKGEIPRSVGELFRE